ncbi:MAG: hypothetical protein J2P50_07510 [Hyphomicrobiaceae bacterium]|nr:hypothetical protein [Hyphomicrobiaceae bacterium]
MLPRCRNRTALIAGGLALWALALGACDSIALEGKVFDWMGLSPSALDLKRADPKMAERAPLVVPPNVARLPEPGSGKTTNNDLAALNDPELRKQAAAKERERLHLAYCRGEIQWKEKALDQAYSATYKSPYGPCPSLFSLNGLAK